MALIHVGFTEPPAPKPKWHVALQMHNGRFLVCIRVTAGTQVRWTHLPVSTMGEACDIMAAVRAREGGGLFRWSPEMN